MRSCAAGSTRVDVDVVRGRWSEGDNRSCQGMAVASGKRTNGYGKFIVVKAMPAYDECVRDDMSERVSVVHAPRGSSADLLSSAHSCYWFDADPCPSFALADRGGDALPS